MKTIKFTLLIALIGTLSAPQLTTHAQGTAFTYQGRLNNNGTNTSGIYDLRFTLFNTNTTGAAIAGPVTNATTSVSNGLFTASVNFGSVFTGASNWLELAVRTNGAASFTTLAPRQQLTPVPYALFATTASNVTGALPAAQLTGTISPVRLPITVVTNNASSVVLDGTFSGDGAGLTNLNASQLTSGTIPDARLSANVSLLGGTIDSSEIVNGTIVNLDINASAAIADTKLATIATAGKVANSATTATSANTANSIVMRDALGNFSAGTISGNFSGNGTGLTNLILSSASSGGAVFTTNITGAFGFTLDASYLTGFSPYSVAAADFNNDGKMDWVVTGYESVQVFTNSGGGHFTLASTPTNLLGLAVGTGDFNNDGRMDIVVAHAYLSMLVVYTNSGNANFVQASQANTSGDGSSSIAVTDFNGDGRLDVATADRGYILATNKVSVFTNSGSGLVLSSRMTVERAPDTVIAGELNGDGLMDLVVSHSQTNRVYVYFGLGNGTFTLTSSVDSGAGLATRQRIALGDIDGNSKLDLVVSGRASNTTEIRTVIFTNTGAGALRSNSVYTVHQTTAIEYVVASDLNLDGRTDVAVFTGLPNQFVVYTNAGNGSLAMGTTVATGVGASSVGVADLTNDGSPDLFSALEIEDKVEIYLSTPYVSNITATFQGTFNSSAVNVLGNSTVNGFNIVSQTAFAVTNNTTVTAATGYVKLFAAAAVTLNTTTAIANGPAVGALLMLEGSSDVNTVTVPQTANTRLVAARTLGIRDILTLMWNGNNWLEVSFANNN